MKERMKQLYHKEGTQNFLSALMAIILGLLVGLIILMITNISQAFAGFGAILTGGMKDMRSLGQVLYFATPIIMTGLSVGFANKTGLFNIGASGQFIVGAFVAIYIGVRWTFLPGGLHWVVALLFATLAGALWGSIPGLLKAFRNVNEVIACIMMNYIGMYLVNYAITLTIHDKLKNQTMRVADTANIPKMGLDKIFRSGNAVSSVGGGIIIAILMCILIYFVIEKTRFGYELKACGFNRDAAKYAGISENRSIVFSMVIAGALAGLGGGLLYLAGAGKGIDVVDVLAAEGFNGIPVSLLGMNNPIGILFSGILIAYLTQGGFNMQLYHFAPEIIDIITAVIIYFSALALLLRSVLDKIGRRISPEREAQLRGEGPPTAGPPGTDLPAAGLPTAGPPGTDLPAAGLPTAGLPAVSREAGLPAISPQEKGLPAVEPQEDSLPAVETQQQAKEGEEV